VTSECTLSAIRNLLNPLIVHWSLRARFQQLLDFGISAASGWHTGRGARLLLLPPEENRDSELLQLVTWFAQRDLWAGKHGSFGSAW
jgi:hypothetical protein